MPIRNLVERRVPHVLAIYLGAAFGVVQFVDFVGSRYLLPAVWTDLAFLSMALLLPSVVLYTYNHARPGPDEWRRSEKVFIPVNLLILVGLVTVVGAGAPLAPTSQRITVTDEQGNTREVMVANKAYRKRVAFFMFDSPADSAVKWLQHGLPLMTMEDLQQSLFIEAMPSLYMRKALQEKGYAEGLNVPLSLKREVVSELHVPHFVAGRVDTNGNEYTVTVQLYETESAKLVRERTYRGPDVVALADEISAGVLEDLKIPTLRDSKPDMPVAEILSTNRQAIRAYLEATGALLVNMDWATAAAKSAEAVKLDPTFASAHFLQFMLARLANQPQLAKQAAKAALDHSYRLPERTRDLVKANYYVSKEEYQNAYAVLEMMAKLYPDDIQVQTALLEINVMRDDKDALISSLKKILELDPTRAELLLELGRVHEARGESKQALQYYEQYAAKFPTDVRGPRQIGITRRRLGEHAQAKAALEKALLIKPDDPGTLLDLARVHLVLGDFAAAQQKFSAALEGSATPQDKVEAYAARENMHRFRGEIRESIKSREAMLAELAGFAPQLGVLQHALQLVGSWARIDAAMAERKLNELRGQLSAPPGNLFLPLAEIPFYIETGDAVQAEAALARLDAVIAQNSFNFLRPVAVEGRGRLEELRGNCEEAVRWYREASRLDPNDVALHTDSGRCLRKLKRTREAEAELAKAVRVMPADGQANLQLGLLFQETGDLQKARGYLRRAAATWQNADAAYKPAAEARAALARLER